MLPQAGYATQRTCLMLMMYLASGVPASMIFVILATCSAWSSLPICLSATRSHMDGGASPVSLSLMPAVHGRRYGDAWVNACPASRDSSTQTRRTCTRRDTRRHAQPHGAPMSFLTAFSSFTMSFSSVRIGTV